MPGPIHGGILYAEQWAPGAGVAGVDQRHEIGDFSEDMVIVGVYIQEGTGAVTSRASLLMAKSGSRSKYSVFSRIFTNSPLFNPALAGNRIELGVYLPAHEQAILEITHTGTDTLKWLILVAPPPVSDRQLASMLEQLAPEARE